MWEKLSLQIQSMNIMYPNKKNMIAVPITKRMQLIMSIQVCLISQMNINYKENGGKKSFSCKIQGIQIAYPNVGNMIAVPITKRMKIITSCHVCLISWINFKYKENSGNKSFYFKSQASIWCIPMRGTWLSCSQQKERRLWRISKFV